MTIHYTLLLPTKLLQSIPKLIITESVYVGIQDKNRVDGYLPSKAMM